MITLGNNVLILPDKMKLKSEKGLDIPETAKDTTHIGTVIQVGGACENIKAGDRVQFPRAACTIIDIDGIEYFCTNEHKIMYYEQR
jgi:co-chaperonin GroES (HSP10)